MTSAETSAIIKADEAHKNYEQTVACRANLQSNFLVLGKLLKDNRDSSLFKFLGYDGFDDYLGAPELGFKRSTAYGLIKLVELYINKLNVPAARLVSVGTTKLGKIAGVVEDDVEGWLSKAEHLSKSSLDEEIGRGPGTKLSPPKSPAPAPPMSPLGNIGKAETCVNGCGPGEKSHFPITRGAGGKEVEDWWIPCCSRCHKEYHADPKEWMWKYKRNWAKYLYERITRHD